MLVMQIKHAKRREGQREKKGSEHTSKVKFDKFLSSSHYCRLYSLTCSICFVWKYPSLPSPPPPPPLCACYLLLIRKRTRELQTPESLNLITLSLVQLKATVYYDLSNHGSYSRCVKRRYMPMWPRTYVSLYWCVLILYHNPNLTHMETHTHWHKDT